MYAAFGKRLFDILFALSSVFLLSPIILLVILLIVVFDPGPLIFQQQRVGRRGKLFWFFKFRSMPVNIGNIPSGKINKVKLSWVGRFIRRTNLDELPQLLNILKGDMSIVGPRPPIPSQVDLVAIRGKNGSLECRPGLTGLAQVKSFDGMSASEKASYDGLYAKDISLISDIKIILSTFLYLLKPPPVY